MVLPDKQVHLFTFVIWRFGTSHYLRVVVLAVSPYQTYGLRGWIVWLAGWLAGLNESYPKATGTRHKATCDMCLTD